MKKRNLIAICLVCLSFVGCQKFHTGKVVIDDKKNEEKVENVEYLVVDEEDKESLIKNIKSGKGAVIDKRRNQVWTKAMKVLMLLKIKMIKTITIITTAITIIIDRIVII